MTPRAAQALSLPGFASSLWFGSILGTRAGPAPPAATCLRKIGRCRRRSSAWPAVMRRTPTPKPQGIFSGRGTPDAPVRQGNPASSLPDRSDGESIPVFNPGSWPEGIPFLSAFVASEARGRGVCQCSRRLFGRRCIDWSERKPHIGGAFGEALAETLLERDWIRQSHESRCV